MQRHVAEKIYIHIFAYIHTYICMHEQMAALQEVRESASQIAFYEGVWLNDLPHGKGAMCDPTGA